MSKARILAVRSLDTDKPDWAYRLVEFLRKMPARVGDVGNHFGMTEPFAKDVLWAAEQQGIVFLNDDGLWEALDDD